MYTKVEFRKNRQQYNAGDKYGILILTGKSYIGGKSRRYVEVICECGAIKFMKFDDIRSGHTKSCGCKRKPHGMSPLKGKGGHPLYSNWMNIKTRCYQKSHRSYPDYGGIGLTVCDEWLKSFKSFFDWSIENGWKEGLSIDRIDNNKGYYPKNCRWATDGEQSRNRTDNVNITAFGETKCLMDWVKDERCIVAFNTVRQRMKKLKWDAEKALSYPSMNDEGNNYKRDNSILIEYNNETKNLMDWCRVLGLKYTTVRSRVVRGWTGDKLFKK